MKQSISAIALILYGFSLHAQFSRVDVNNIDLTNEDQTWATGENDFVVLADDELFVLQYSDTGNISYEKISNMITDVDQVVLYDRNNDGHLDLHVYGYGNPDYHVYLRDGDNYIYEPQLNFGSSNAHNLHFQDFNGDGKDEVMISHGIFTYPELERIWRYPLINDYKYGLVDFVDYDTDGDRDVLLHQVNRIHIIENTGADFSTTNVSIPETDNSTSWLRKLKTTQGDRYLYYKYSDPGQGIYELSFTDGGSYNLDYKLEIELSQADKAPLLADLDQDGNDEIITRNNNFANNVVVLNYDSSTGDVTHKSFYTGSVSTLGVKDYEGKPSIIIGNEENIQTYVLNDNGDFVVARNDQLNIIPTSNPFYDVDGDGYIDVLSFTPADTDELIKRYLGEGNFEHVTTLQLPDDYGRLEDFDDDGDLDYVNEDTWYENLDGLSFGAPMSYTIDDPTPDPQIFFTAEMLRDDLDGDGDLDILTYNFFGEPLALLENNDNQDFASSVELVDNDVISGDLALLEAVDVNADGIKDIVMVTVTGAIWLPGQGSLEFGSPQQIYTGQHKPFSADLDDFNKDGFVDLIIGSRNIIAGSAQGETTVYTGNSDGFEKYYEYSAGAYHRVEFANINEGTWLEAIVKNSLGLVYFELGEDGSIIQQNVDQDNSIVNFKMIITDANGDDDMDILLYDEGDSDVRYYLNQDITTDQEDGCPIGNVIIRNMQQLHDFVEIYGNCTRISGNLFLGNDQNDWTDLEDFTGLENIQVVTGDLTIRFNNRPEELLGLSGLQEVGGDFLIHQWKGDSFAGLEQLHTVGGDFTLSFIQGLTLLRDLRNFESLDYIGGSIEILNSNINNISDIIQATFEGDLIIQSYLDPMFNFDGWEAIDTIKGSLELSGLQVGTFDELSEVDYLGGLSIGFMPFLHTLEIGDKLTSIPGDLGIALSIDYDLTSEFPHLTSVGGDLYLRAKSLSGFHNLVTVGEDLNIYCSELNDQLLAALTEVGTDISLILEGETDFGQFQGITDVNGSLSLGGENITSLSPFNEIDTIKGHLSINSTSLTSLNSLSENLIVEDYITIGRNDKLNLCNHPAICNHVAAGKELSIYQNGFACNEITQIECISNSISGRIYYDLNKNLIWDENEATLPNIRIGFNNDMDSVITSYDGYYVRYLEEGQALLLDISIPDSWASDQDMIQVDSFVPNDVNNANYDYGMYPLQESRSLEMDINQGLFLCDREFKLFVDVQNKGTQAELPIIKVNYPSGVVIDTGYMDFTNHDIDLGILTYELDSLFPFFHEQLIIPFVAPSAVNLGDIYTTSIEIESTQNNEPYTYQEVLNEILLCSYDPNDKLVNSSNGTNNLYINDSDELEYTIRFQNTGNYYAETVRIQDTLSTALDLLSFEFMSASHPVEIRQDDRVFSFIFNDIMLPDSTRDLAGSQGYVKFKINAMDGIELGDMIENTGHIYFDFNEAIVTNTVVSELVDPTSVENIYNHHDKVYDIYPNPAAEWITVRAIDHRKLIKSIELFDLNGAFILRSPNQYIDISSLDPGYYMIKVIDRNGDMTPLSFVKH